MGKTHDPLSGQGAVAVADPRVGRIGPLSRVAAIHEQPATRVREAVLEVAAIGGGVDHGVVCALRHEDRRVDGALLQHVRQLPGQQERFRNSVHRHRLIAGVVVLGVPVQPVEDVAQPDRLANQPGAPEREGGRENEGSAHRVVGEKSVYGEQSSKREAADEDVVYVFFQRLEPEAGSRQPVAASHVEQVSRPRAVARQQHHADQEAARRERIGQVTHGQGHVGQPVQKQYAPSRAAARRRRASIGGRALEGSRSGELHLLPVRVHVHLVAFEPFARLPDIVFEIAITAGIERQPLAGGLKPRAIGFRARGRRFGGERLADHNETNRGQGAHRRCYHSH